jgi:hypothetical protein
LLIIQPINASHHVQTTISLTIELYHAYKTAADGLLTLIFSQRLALSIVLQHHMLIKQHLNVSLSAPLVIMHMMSILFALSSALTDILQIIQHQNVCKNAHLLIHMQIQKLICALKHVPKGNMVIWQLEQVNGVLACSFVRLDIYQIQ